MVVCAPTASGKTLVAEIAVLKALQCGIHCIYLVSHKALADQKYADFERRFGADAPETIASVGLSTGDRDEGDASPQLLVATYEKALALLLSGQMDPASALVIADELQITGELEGDFVDPLPPVSIRHRSSGRPAAGNDNGFTDRLLIFLLADRMHRLQLRQQLVDERTQPRPRRAVRE